MGASFTQGTIPSIPIGGSISPEGFLLPILLLVMIIATVVVTVVVVVAVGGVPSILKLSFMAGQLNSTIIKLPHLLKPVNETNSSFRTIEVERLTTHSSCASESCGNSVWKRGDEITDGFILGVFEELKKCFLDKAGKYLMRLKYS
ncbi:hypothetical protein Tco_0199335 [Tanacetum coccineum]